MTRAEIGAAGERREVRLLGIPADRYRLISEHHDEVTRELKLVADPQHTPPETPARVVELAPLLGQGFKALVKPLRAAMAEARARREATADAAVALDPAEARQLRTLHELLCTADEAARAGELLALPLDPEAVDLRAWIVDEVEAQVLRGRAPSPWPG